jgi:hypothetical protein
MPLITRICTVYRQWPQVAAWLTRDELFTGECAWIFVNDCPENPPPDAVGAILQQRGALLHEMRINGGRSQARNTGTALARTPWVEHVDGDDRPLPLPSDELSPDDVGLVFFPVLHQGPGSENLPAEPTFTYHGRNAFFDLVFASYLPMDWRPCSTLWRRETLNALGGFDARFEPVEDIYLVWRAVRAGVRAGHAPVAKQCYTLAGKHLDQDYIGWALKLRLLAAMGADKLEPGWPSAWQEEYICTLKLLHWQTAALLEQRGENLRLHFLSESVKHLWRALRGSRRRGDFS